MSKAQETRHRIIEQAAALFNQQGYSGSSIADIMQVTGLQKGGIYNHFASKDDLALAAFDYAAERFQQRFMSALKGKRHAVDRLVAIIDIYEHLLDDPPLPGGCPLMNTAIESDDAYPALRSRSQQAMDRWRALLRRIVEKGVQRGEFRPETDSDTVATIVIATIEGAVMLSKLYGDPIHLQRALGHLRTFVQSQAISPE